ncbi:hypothetical protein DNTS_016264, partial [Danionella cerebrum]
GSLEEKAGDPVLWDIKQRRDEEKRLREIQQQLQILEEDQHAKTLCLSEDQLRDLLLDCEAQIMTFPESEDTLMENERMK